MSFLVAAAILNCHNYPLVWEIRGEESLVPNKHVVAVIRFRFMAQIHHIVPDSNKLTPSPTIGISSMLSTLLVNALYSGAKYLGTR